MKFGKESIIVTPLSGSKAFDYDIDAWEISDGCLHLYVYRYIGSTELKHVISYPLVNVYSWKRSDR